MSDGRAVFITGGSGFLGRTLIPALVNEGYHVKALARSTDAARIVADLGAEPVYGDLSDLDALQTGLAGCAYAIHGAARFLEGGGYRAYYQDNVGRTRSMLAAAKTAGVRRFVWIGAAACLLGGKPIQNADESWPLHEKYSPYVRTKTIADRMVRAANATGFTTCVVRPAWIWGKEDDPLLASMAQATIAGKMVFIDGGTHEIVTSHVDNTVRAIVRALDKGAGGQAYFAFDDDTIRARDFMGQMLATRGLMAPDKNVPFALAWVMACAMETIWTIVRRRGTPPVNRLLVKLNGGPFVVSDRKARVELGYSPIISRADALARLRTRPAS